MDEEINQSETDSHRFFRVDPEIYEGIRAYLDVEFSHPKPGTETCLPPASIARKDSNGNILASATHFEVSLGGELIDSLISSEHIEEISREEWNENTQGGEQ